MSEACDVLIQPSHGWRRISMGAADGWIKGSVSDKDVSQAFQTLGDYADAASAQAALRSLRGHFAIVVRHRNWVCATVDRIRSIPLVWACDENKKLFIAQEGRTLLSALNINASSIDEDQALAVALAGYTIGDATLYKNVKTLLPGCFLFSKAGQTVTDSYHRFTPWKADQVASDDVVEKKHLAQLTLSILAELIDRADGRTIALPLSAGLDSRLIAAGLKHLGYRNVVCFAYGRTGNHEAETSRLIAERLGYPWHFVPYSNRSLRKIFASEDYAAYTAYADSLTGVHFPQDYPALTALLADGTLPPDCILVNGQSGDFISGNHIPASLETSAPLGGADTDRLERIVDALVKKHFKQWRFLMGEDKLSRIRAMLRAEIGVLIGGQMPDVPSADYGIYEVAEFVDRQSKYVVNGQRVYEYLDIDWALPLWDDRYLEYWADRPIMQKTRQRLYREMLMEANWAGVWQDISVNEKRIRPRWLIPVRLVLKVLHVPLGKARWHLFERRFLDYLMTPLCSYAVRSWLDIAMDQRGPWTGICPHVENYLHDHGIAIDSLAGNVQK